MAKIIITEHTYIFFIDYLHDIEQNTFSSDKDALIHAKELEKKLGKKVLVARWLEDE